MIKLFCFPRSGNSREVKLALAEKNIPYEPIDIHSNKEAAESEDFKKASPNKKVPAIIDGDVYMNEAFLINQYLEKKFPNPPLMPKDAAKAQEVIQFVTLYDKKLVLQIGLLVIECLLKPKDQQKEEVKAKQKDLIRQALGDLDKMLEGKDYLFGDYSLADISITPHVAALPILGTSIPAEFKNMTTYFERIKARPSFKLSQS